jgi:hypothetical protein
MLKRITKVGQETELILTDKTKYGLPLYVKHNYSEEYGGPLFWAHYSYIGLDPRGLSDKYIKIISTLIKIKF